MFTRRRFVAVAAAALPVTAALSGIARAGQPQVFARDGIAINGYDPVAYFTMGKPVRGEASHSLTWNGADWHFASAETKAAFEADPQAFAPQYGGYCAYAVSKGATAKTEPDAWTIHEGKLYLNYDITVRGIWSEDIPGNIARADANWPAVLN